MVFYPGNDGGTGTVTVYDVEVEWTITIIDPEIPTYTRRDDPDDPHKLPYVEHLPCTIRFDMTQSVGEEMILTIGDAPPVILRNERELWVHSHRFVREGTYNVHLVVNGGEISKEEFAVIEILPVAPVDSDRVVIRIRKLAASREEYTQFSRVQDQA